MSKKSKVTEEVTEQEDKVLEEEELSLEESQTRTIEELEETIKQLQNDYLKEKADLENIKKRLEKERTIERKYAAMNFAKKLVSPLDTFELALSHTIEDEKTKISINSSGRMSRDEVIEYAKEIY